MKKLISIILTACMCLSLLGGISFAGAADAEATYLFSLKDANLISYNDETQIHLVNNPSNWNFANAQVGGKTDSGKNFQLRTGGYLLCKTTASNDYIALTIEVPVTGKYVLDYSYFQNYGNNQPRGGYGNVYLVKGELNATQIAEELQKSENKYFEDIQYFSDVKSSSWGKSTSSRFVNFSAGKYTLIFSVSEKSEEINTTEQGQTFRMWPSSLTLVPVSGKTYTFDKDAVNVSSSWDSSYAGTNYESTIVPVKDYGTHGYKYFDADNETYNNVEKSGTALQFSGSGYFRLRSYVEDLFNNENGAKLALAFEKPYTVPSFYAVSLYPSTSDNTATKAEFYMENIDSQKATVEEYTVPESRNGTSYNFSSVSAQNKDNELDELVYCNGKNDLMISFFTGAGGNLRISSLTLTPVDVSSITLNAPTTLEVDETSTVKVMAGEKSVVDSFVTYTVTEETDVIDIAPDGTVTAKAAGTATIIATVGELSDTATIEVTEPVTEEPENEPEEAPTEIKYGVFVNEKACATDVTANGVALNEATGLVNGTLNQGETLTAIAKDEASGYKFRYWVLGSAATGRYYSSEKTVTVTPYANIALTAIYTADSVGNVVDLFNYNGEFLQTLTNLSDLAIVTPTMVGHTFANKWILADKTELKTDTVLITPVTQAVAQYTKNAGYETENVNEDSTCGWMRNGKLVTYDEDYTFLTWLNEVGIIEKNAEEITDKIPLAVLESNGNNYMLEYDEGEYEVVEAGILFGSTDSIDVKSAYSKAMVKRLEENGGHGQMTATSMGTANETYARGYVMYRDKNDNDKIKVIYSK